MNYCDFLFKTREEDLSNIALIDAENGRRLTYLELQQKVVQVAEFLRRKGYGPGDVILSHLYNGNEAAIVHLAIQYIGAVTCLVDPLFKAHEMDYYITDSGARCVITYLEPAELRLLTDSLAEILHATVIEEVVWGDQHPRETGIDEYHQYQASDLGLLLYTSGSTSQPKAVMLCAGSYEVFLRKNDEGMYRYDPTDRILCFVPFSHGFGSISILIPSLAYKAATVFMRTFHPVKVAEIIPKERITHIFGVPTHYQQLLRLESLHPQLRMLKAAFCAAAPLNYDTTLAWYKTIGIYLDEGYGMTETCTLITTRMNRLPDPAGNVGVTVSILQVEIVDDEKRPVKNGVVGEFRVKGPGVMLGYLNKPEETAERLQDGWVYTGDLGYRQDDGSFVICGRKTDYINCAGLKISPVEIEAVLNSFEGVVDSAAVGVKNDLYGEVVKAFVLLKPGANPTERELIKYCTDKLASFKVPKTITFVEEFPRNNLGKIDKKALKAMDDSLTA